jgi:hypothetical protein
MAKSGLLLPKKLSVFFPVSVFVLHPTTMEKRSSSVNVNLKGFIKKI